MSIEKYDPIRLLGEGSFGKVYLMRDKIKRNFVCVKVIKIKNIPKKERESTRLEVELLRRLNHPNIVRYHESFLSKNNETLCIVMEFCDGGDLATQIKAAKKNLFSESKILHWFVQIALGLHYMHSNKVLHRDLKTQNVFLLGNGRLVLGDFGISKVLDGTMDFASTCIGTPYYMSPEIFQNKPYSYKSDVWALGCVLYEMTTLNHAFDSNSLNGLAGKIVKGRYPPINPKYSKGLRDMISAMLLINPQQRPDLDQILRKSLIKKHIINFLADVASRPSNSIGEGTMIVRAAAGGFIGNDKNDDLASDNNVISLHRQLKELEMTELIQEAITPKPLPTDEGTAKKLAKQQISALHREEEHKQMVEAALEKLRLDREVRMRDRQQSGNNVGPAGVGGRVRPAAGGPGPIGNLSVAAVNNAMRPPMGAVRPPVPSRAGVVASSAVSGKDSSNNREAPPPYSKKPSMDNNPVDMNRGRVRGVEDRISRNPSIESISSRNAPSGQSGPSIQKINSREDIRRGMGAVDPRTDQRAKEESRLKEEVANRQRDEIISKQRNDDLRLQQQQQAIQAAQQQQIDVAARKEAQKEKERQKQRDEIEQLKKDKIELDRLTQERKRMQEERSKLNSESKSGDYTARNNSGGSSSINDSKAAYQAPNKGINRYGNNDNSYDTRAEDKYSDMNARDRVLLQKQDKLARDEADRIEALREAELINRRLREQADIQKKNLYNSNIRGIGVSITGNSGSNSGGGSIGGGGGYESNLSSIDSRFPQDNTEHWNDESTRKPTKSNSGNNINESKEVLSRNDLAQKLQEVTNGNISRYDSNPAGPGSAAAAISVKSQKSTSSHSYIIEDDRRITSALDDLDEDDDLFIGASKERTELDELDEEEDMVKKEDELRAELQRSTMKCMELQKSLRLTTHNLISLKSQDKVKIMGMAGKRPQPPPNSSSSSNNNNSGPNTSSSGGTTQATNSTISTGIMSQESYSRTGEDEDDRENLSELLEIDEDDEEDEDDSNESSSLNNIKIAPLPPTNSVTAMNTRNNDSSSNNNYNNNNSYQTPVKVPLSIVTDNRPLPVNLSSKPNNSRNQQILPKYHDLQDPPTPSGFLADRTNRIRNKCIDGLGKELFQKAYRVFKQYYEEDNISDSRSGGGSSYPEDTEMERKRVMRTVLNENQMSFVSLIEQIYLMEESHK